MTEVTDSKESLIGEANTEISISAVRWINLLDESLTHIVTFEKNRSL